MDLGSLDIFKGFAAKMAWLTQRQNVIAQNIANADTPEYQARDIAPLDFKNTLNRQMAPERTNPMHMASASEGVSRTEPEKKTYEVSPSGNSVSIEEQMQKASQTGVDYQMIATLYQKNLGLIKTALDRGGSN